MRVTIGERLGLRPKVQVATKKEFTTSQDDDPGECTDGWHGWTCRCMEVKRRPTEEIPSSPIVPQEADRPIQDGPPRVRGEMVWLHKTAPTLVIEGRPGLSPEEHVAGRRR